MENVSANAKWKGMKSMPITELLRQNAEKYANDVSLVEITPPPIVKGRLTWKEYALIESGTTQKRRTASQKSLCGVFLCIMVQKLRPSRW